jgi:hypothetical protein
VPVAQLCAVKNASGKYLGFRVDKLTRSVESAITGESFATNISLLLLSDLRRITKKNSWLFNWKAELKFPEREVYKLTIAGAPASIEGLVSLSTKIDHVFMNLIESAPSNRGKNKVYLGVPGNLVAFLCRLSFQRGFDGFVAFHSKTKLIEHYKKTLGARVHGGHLMVIDTIAAKNLVDKYFKS